MSPSQRKENPQKKSFAMKEGTIVDNYELLSKIGIGGMGVVYKAKDLNFGRIVAIKFILASRGKNSRAAKRFFREVKACAQLAHKHIIKLYSVGIYHNNPYMVMECIEGSSLEEYVKENSCTLEEKLTILLKISLALDFAHKKNILHRDIKPANIMIRTNGEPVLMDFGLAKMLDTKDATLTKTGEIMGSPKYMAPEQVEGRKRDFDARTDVYALGGILYRLLTGVAPVEVTSLIRLFHQVTNVPPKPPTSICEDIPEVVEEICLTALEKQNKNRQASAKIFAQQIDDYLTGKKQETNKKYQKRKRLLEWKRRYYSNRKYFIAGVLLLLCVSIILIFYSIAGTLNQETITNYYNKALKEYQRKKYRKALNAIAIVLKYQKNYESYILQGKISTYLKKHTLARESFMRALDLRPKKMRVILELGSYTKAEYQRMLTLLNKEYNIENLRLKTIVYRKLNKMREVNKQWKYAYNLPKKKSLIHFRGMTQEEKNEALKKLNDFGKNDFGCYSLFFERAKLNISMGNIDNTLADISSAIELHPAPPYPYYLLKAKCLTKKGYQRNAYEVYTHLLSIASKEDKIDLKAQLAILSENLGLLAKAYSYYKDTYISNSRPILQIKLIELAIKQQKYQEATKYIKKIRIKNKEVKIGVLYYKGKILSQNNEYTKAIQKWKKALNLLEKSTHKKYQDIELEIGNSYFCLSNYNKAIKFLNRAYKQFPHNVNILCKLASCYIEKSKKENAQKNKYKAISCLSKCIKIEPWKYQYYNKRGNLYFDVKKYSLAEQDFETCMKYNPNDLKPYLRILACIFQKGIMTNYSKIHMLLSKATNLRLKSNNPELFEQELKALQHLQKSNSLIIKRSKISINEDYFIEKFIYNNYASVHRMASNILLLNTNDEINLIKKIEKKIQELKSQKKIERLNRLKNKLIEKFQRREKSKFTKYLVRYYINNDEKALKEIYHKKERGIFGILGILKDENERTTLRFLAAKALGDLKNINADKELEKSAYSKSNSLITKLFCQIIVNNNKNRYSDNSQFKKDNTIFFKVIKEVKDLYAQSLAIRYMPIKLQKDKRILLSFLMQKEISKKIQLCIAAKLHLFNIPQALSILEKGFADRNPLFRAFCVANYYPILKKQSIKRIATTIKKIEYKLIQATKDKDEKVRRIAVLRLGNIAKFLNNFCDKDFIKKYIRKYKLTHRQKKIYRDIKKYLIPINFKRYIENLSKRINDKDLDTRLEAIIFLGKLGKLELLMPKILDQQEATIIRAIATFSVSSEIEKLAIPKLFDFFHKFIKDKNPLIRLLVFIKAGEIEIPKNFGYDFASKILKDNVKKSQKIIRNSYVFLKKADKKERKKLLKIISLNKATLMGCILGMAHRKDKTFFHLLNTLLKNKDEKIRNLAAMVMSYLMEKKHQFMKLRNREPYLSYYKNARKLNKAAALGCAKIFYENVTYFAYSSKMNTPWNSETVYRQFINNAVYDSRKWCTLRHWKYIKRKIKCRKYVLYLKFLNKAIQLDNSNSSLLFERGVIYYAGKKYSSSLTDIKRAVKLNPNSNFIKKWLAKSYYKNKYYEKALKLINPLLYLSPWNYELWKIKKKIMTALKKEKEEKECGDYMKYLKKAKSYQKRYTKLIF